MDYIKQDNIIVELTTNDLDLILHALKDKYLELLGDYLDYDVDNEDEQKEYKEVFEKLHLKLNYVEKEC